MLLIGIDKNGKLEQNGWVEIPEFSELYKRFGDSGVKALILIWDSGGPYTRMKEEEREKRVATQQLGLAGYEVYLKSSQYQKAKFLYQALDYDELIESRRILQKKLIELNTQLDQLSFTPANADTIKLYTQLQTRMLNDIAGITVRISERGTVKKDLSMIMLSGIEVFYNNAKKNRTEQLLYRNLMRIERRNVTLAEEKKKELAAKQLKEAEENGLV